MAVLPLVVVVVGMMLTPSHLVVSFLIRTRTRGRSLPANEEHLLLVSVRSSIVVDPTRPTALSNPTNSLLKRKLGRPSVSVLT